jgi:nucleoside permease NupC
VLAAYIGFGVPASQLLTASIMAAPAGLALAKVIYPETKKSLATWDSIKNFEKGLV